MEVTKENAKGIYIQTIKSSWTYGLLTEEERQRVMTALWEAKVFGTIRQREEILHSVYYGFLLALDYKPTGWREEA